MPYATVLVEKSDGVAVVTLNRPEKKNAMNPQLHEDMTAVLEGLRYDDEARVLVITGAGDTFCAGMDLKEVFHALKDQPAKYDRVIRISTASGRRPSSNTSCRTRRLSGNGIDGNSEIDWIPQKFRGKTWKELKTTETAPRQIVAATFSGNLRSIRRTGLASAKARRSRSLAKCSTSWWPLLRTPVAFSQKMS